MADTTLVLNGFSIIGDPHTNSNASHGGNLMIHDGTAVFEDDDIIVFQVEGATEDGVLTDDSVIVGAIVYDNASDYLNDVPKYTYDAPPGGGADIDMGRDTMGDRYLEFDAGSLNSSDAGAPDLGEVAVVAGVDILGTLESTNGPFVVPTNEDIDLNGDGVISDDEEADASFSSSLNILTEPTIEPASICFTAGTLIETPMGPQAVETLKAGDLVNTLDDGPQPIQWIGGRKTTATGAHAPVLLRAGSVGNVRDLRVSQNHRLVVTGHQAELLFGQAQVLVAAKHLVNGRTVRIEPGDEVEYWHFLLKDHQIVFAECCPSESLYPGKQSLNSVTPLERDEIISLFPELDDADCDCALSRYEVKAYEARVMRAYA